MTFSRWCGELIPIETFLAPDFDEIVEMLSEGINARRGRQGAHLHRDRVNQRLLGRRGSRLVAITNGGAIPDNALYTVVAEPEGNTVGTVDEDFAVESLRGDIMLLGNTSWRIRRIQAGRVLVEDAHGAPPNVPFLARRSTGTDAGALAASCRIAREDQRDDSGRGAGNGAERIGGGPGRHRVASAGLRT